MSVRDPVLDAQHIELLELCRTVQDMVQRGRHKSDLFVQRLEEILLLLREHDRQEASALLARGEHLAPALRIHRAQAQQQLEQLSIASPAQDMAQAKIHAMPCHAMLCGWIRYHLH